MSSYLECKFCGTRGPNRLCRDVLQAEPAECEVRVSEVTMQPRSKRIVWVKRR